MVNYALMFTDFSDKRLNELAKNCFIWLKNPIKGPVMPSERDVAMKGMYATEELKNRGYEDTMQDLIAEIAEEKGLFNAEGN